MTVKISWHTPKRVILSDFSGQTTLDDIEALSAALPKMLKEGTPPVHWLIDIRNEVKPFRDFRILFKKLTFVQAEEMGWVVIVGRTNDVLIRTIINMVALFFSARCRRFECYEDAVDFLNNADDTLELSA